MQLAIAAISRRMQYCCARTKVLSINGLLMCPSSGKVLALELRMYMDGGAATDNTLGDMDMAMLWADNVYYFPNYHAKVRTHRHR
jgi:hypothetical protein